MTATAVKVDTAELAEYETEVSGGNYATFVEARIMNVMRQVKAQNKGIARLNRKIFRLENALKDAMSLLTPAQTMELLRRGNNKSLLPTATSE